MDAWIAALASLTATVVGALIAWLGTRQATTHEDRRRQEDRVWEEKKTTYMPIISWLGVTDDLLHDIYYSYSDFVRAQFIDVVDEWPTPILKKRAEYRSYDRPEDWHLPKQLNPKVDTLLKIFAPPRIVDLTVRSSFVATRTVDEAMSLGRNTIRNRDRSSEDINKSDETILGWYKAWLMSSNQLLNAIRHELDPEAVLIPLDRSRLSNWHSFKTK
jgi:hypothetical protein